jgi:hypothetical protein
MCKACFNGPSSGVFLAPGSGSWQSLSDANMKNDFQSLDPVEVLDRVINMPITEWSYKTEGGVRHIGPVAQDFYAAFGLGGDDTRISTVDADGVALAAIQGLHKQLEAEKAENAELRSRLAALEAAVAQLLDEQSDNTMESE